MGNHYDGHTLCVQLGKQFHDLLAGTGVQRTGGFVRQQQPGMAHHGTCDRHTLFLTAGKLGGLEVHTIFQSHTGQHLFCPHQPVFFPHACIEQRQRHILGSGAVLQQRKMLKDKGDLLFGIEQDIDFVAASFIRNAEAINEIREFLVANGGEHIDIIAKIENAEGVQNIDSIIDAADGVMVARGDLGVEIPACQVPHVQKIIIEKCNHKYKPVITATQMLDSMIRNPRPTRAEVADVANAIYDGTDAIMLSGETAAGKYPIEAVTMMGEIAEQTERYLKFEDYRDGKALEGKLNVSAAVGSAAVSMVEHIKAACIVTPTMSGQTARLISNLRPSVPIYGVTPYEWARRKMQLYWGVRPVTGYEEDSTENIISHAMYMVRREELVERGDMVIFTAGDPATNEVTGEGYMTNMLHIIQAK